VVVVLLVVAGLALAGVFSGGNTNTDSLTTTGSSTQSTPTTTQSRVTTTTSTTQTTPTNPSAASVPTTTLKSGSTGAEVKLLQHALTQLGYKPGAVDGIFGPNTEAAVMSFQTASKLAPDGVVGPLTLAALGKALRSSG
jgi:peptidoglycan hydrolase-like protein with peptidoglycan-binding domain